MDFPTLVLTLLSGNWVFFTEDEIAWDGQHHQITGIQVNAAQVSQFMEFVSTAVDDFDDIQEVIDYFIGFLTEAEKDEGLIVPRESIAPGIRNAIREGDLTGITLANLAACGAAFQVKLQEADHYVVLYDVRLGAGIPSFFTLIARLLWDLRQCLKSQSGVPFSVAFVGARSIDADECLGDVSNSVTGAQDNPGVMQVASRPEIDLASHGADDASRSDAADSCPEPFHSGFDEPDVFQEDEERFEECLAGLARTFPKTIAIEGTHVHGRAERIEAIKPGDKLTLATDWQTEFFNPVGIEVFNEKGETLGYLNEQCSFTHANSRELACLLPFITASVASVTPLSQRRKNARHALMDIRLELDEAIVPPLWERSINQTALKAIKDLLAKPKAQRVVLSRSSLLPSQLKGSVDTSEALENPYGDLEFNTAPQKHSDAIANIADETPAEEEPTEREQTLSLLQLFVLAGQLAGTEFPQELLDELDRAIEGDESIDLEELSERLNNATPDIQTTDFSDISFSQNRRVDGRRFSIAVPDGWSILKDAEEGGILSITRPFIILPHEASEGDDVSLSDRIMYSGISGDTEVDEEMLEYGISAVQWAFLFCNSYSKTDGLGAMKPTFLWDEEVDAINTKCFVAITDPINSPNGLDCYIHPYALDHSDFLRGTFNYDENTDLEQVKNFVIQIAKSIELDSPIQTKSEEMLNKALQKRVSSGEYTDMVASLIKPFMGIRQLVFTAALQKYTSQNENAAPDDILLAGASAITDYTNRAIPILTQLLDAYDKQASLGATQTELNQMSESLQEFDSAVFPTPALFGDDADGLALLEKAGVFTPSSELQQCRARLASLAKKRQDAAEKAEHEKEETYRLYDELALDRERARGAVRIASEKKETPSEKLVRELTNELADMKTKLANARFFELKLKKELPLKITETEAKIGVAKAKIPDEQKQEEKERQQAIAAAEEKLASVEEAIEPYEAIVRAEIREKFRGAEVGSRVEFGTYKYDEDGEARPIQWKVLAKAGSHFVLLSKYTLEYMPFDKAGSPVWENSSLKAWLEAEFTTAAFSLAEQTFLSDKPTLLTIDEFLRYLQHNDRIAFGTPWMEKLPIGAIFGGYRHLQMAARRAR